SSRLEQHRGAFEDRELLLGERFDPLWTVAPFQIRIAAQRAESAAWRIDEHAVDFPGKPADPRIAFARDDERVDVRYAGARGARRERGEPLRRYGDRVDPPGAAHQHRGGERLAPCAGAEVGDHLAAPRTEKVREQLAAFVL